METIKEILIRRDHLTEQEAEDWITDCKEELEQYVQAGDLTKAEQVIMDYFGLEPDYLEELLF